MLKRNVLAIIIVSNIYRMILLFSFIMCAYNMLNVFCIKCVKCVH